MQSCNGFGLFQPQLLRFLLPPVWVLAQSCRRREQQPVILASRQHTDHISIRSYIYLIPLPCRPFFFSVALLCSVSASGLKGLYIVQHLHLGGFNPTVCTSWGTMVVSQMSCWLSLTCSTF